MAVKRKNEKKKKMNELHEKAVKIKCCYCDIKDSCKFRVNKEKTEKMDIVTYCTMTPNRTKGFVKKARTNALGY